MWTFHTRARYDSVPDTLVTLSHMDFLCVLANILDFLVVAVIVADVAVDVCIYELRLNAFYAWKTFVTGDLLK